jgi:uncharacterized protein (TIGR02246 family)
MNVDEQVRSLVQQFGDRWNAYDTTALAQLFADDADLVNAFGIAATGREAIAKFHVALFTAVFKGGRFHGEASRLRMIRPDVAVVDLRWSVTGMQPRENHPTGEMNGLMAMVLTHESGEWRISAMHVMQFPAGRPSVP